MPRTLSAVTILLSAAAGAVDVVTYFAFNQVFASTMTGNLVLLGLGVGQGDWSQIVDNLCAIAGYCGGLVAGTVFAGLMMRRYPWRNAVGATLTLELALLLVVGAFWYGVPENGELARWRLIVLVLGVGLAMGIQAAAARYIGPAGTPTSFMSGTVTNWVSGLVELHKPFSWNWNSPLRIGSVVVAAIGNAVVTEYAPAWNFVAPVVLVVLAILLMAVVTRANHGGLYAGEAQFAPDPRAEVPEAGMGASESPDPVGSGPDDATEGDAGGRPPASPEQPDPEPAHLDDVGFVHGRVLDADGTTRPAAVTLVDMQGRQVHRVHTTVEGRYRLQPPESGEFVLICAPHRMGGGAARPRAVMVAIDGRPVPHDVVLPT